MNKYLKIISINLFIIFIIILFFEFICNFIYIKYYSGYQDRFKYYKSKFVDMSWFNPDDTVYKEKNNVKKRPIITIGCSFVAGVEERNQTFAYEINRITGRKTYNRGVCATGPSMMLYQLKHPDFKKIAPDAEYVIYIYR